MRQVMRVVRQADAAQERHAALHGGRMRLSVHTDRCFNDILQSREVVEEVEVLEDHPDAGFGPRLREMTDGTERSAYPLVPDEPAANGDLAAIDPIQMVDQP